VGGERGHLTVSEPTGAAPSGLTREGARNERPNEEGRRRVKAPEASERKKQRPEASEESKERPEASAGSTAQREHVHGDRAVRTADQRVHVERRELAAQLGRDRGDAHDRADDGGEVGGRRAPEPGEQAGDA
jgi:hypothetical protein